MAARLVQKSARSVQRIVSIPLTQNIHRNLLPSSSTGRPSLTYYHFQIHDSDVPEPPSSSTDTESRWIPKGGVAKWAQKKAVDTWTGFGKAPEGTWKIKVHRLGERLTRNIDFEELALKGVDPALGPKVIDLVHQTSEKVEEAPRNINIPLLYPPSIQSSESALETLRSMLDDRTPRHKKGFWTWLIIAPFTAPFMIIPIIPNLPFFFCCWRSWSHYKAYRASQYLTSLIDEGIIIPQPDTALDTVYKGATLEKPESTSETQPLLQSMLLSPVDIPKLISALDMQPDAKSEISRALEQARARSKSQR
ncbi:mitochondrial K+-H+ exchange-related-domain-containing protein [Mycena floridula]|nr:mitochondrial K+-H+ exchange-related-domain-containing protein [Mycena floridula]